MPFRKNSVSLQNQKPKKMKRLFALLAAASICTFMFACKGNNSDDSDADETDPKNVTTLTLQVSISDVVRELANKPIDPRLADAIDRAVERQKTDTLTDFVTLFAQETRELPLYALFNAGDLRDKFYPGATNDDVIRAIREEASNAYERAFKILSKRLDCLDAANPKIRKLSGSDRILVELPDVKNLDRVRKLLSSTAQLEFWLVAKDDEARKELEVIDQFSNGLVESENEGGNLFSMLTLTSYNSGAIAMAKLADTAAINNIFRKAIRERFFDPKEGLVKFLWGNKPERLHYYGVERDGMIYLYAIENRDGRPLLDGGCIKNAIHDVGCEGPEVNMQMNSEGAREWKRITGENVGRCIAIVIDDQVYMAPAVITEIAAGRSQITGNFTTEEAQDLANMLKTGKMPARIRVEE